MSTIRVNQMQTTQHDGATHINGTSSENLIILRQVLAFHRQGIDLDKITIFAGQEKAKGLFLDMSLLSEDENIELLNIMRMQTILKFD